ncbi:interleukin-7 receptor subunit alpha [Lissotriton helveticus]
MPRIPALTLLLLVHRACCESGLTPDDGQLEDIEPEPPEYECFFASTGDKWNKLTCFLKESIHKYSNITFSVCCNNEDQCPVLKKKKGIYVLKSSNFSLLISCKICIFPVRKEPLCNTYALKKIVKPEMPYNLTITYHKDAKEYIISYMAASVYLKDKLIHQITIRKNNGTWEELPEITFLHFRLLEQKLARGAKYEVRVRSKPNGKYFKGSWSEWSKSEHFKTSDEVPAQEGLPPMAITLSALGALLLVIMIVIVFLWEKRIKPYVWPHIPDHKSTLEQLCKKQRKSHNIIFNPDYFMDLHIHKVDGIQEKTLEECFLEPSDTQGLGVPGENTVGSSPVPDNMLEECPMMQGVQLEGPQEGSLCESGGTSVATLEGSTAHELERSHSGVMQLYARPNMHNRTSKDTGAISGQVICGKKNSEIPGPLTNAIRGLRQEEAYVTMSAFPPTGITQRRQ